MSLVRQVLGGAGYQLQYWMEHKLGRCTTCEVSTWFSVGLYKLTHKPKLFISISNFFCSLHSLLFPYDISDPIMLLSLYVFLLIYLLANQLSFTLFVGHFFVPFMLHSFIPAQYLSTLATVFNP